MKLEYFSLGLVLIVITHVPHVYMAFFGHCCPNDPSETYSFFDCDGEKININPTTAAGTPGTYCKTLKKCFAAYGKTSFRCNISNSEEHTCSNQTEIINVCRGTLTSIAACRK